MRWAKNRWLQIGLAMVDFQNALLAHILLAPRFFCEEPLGNHIAIIGSRFQAPVQSLTVMTMMIPTDSYSAAQR